MVGLVNAALIGLSIIGIFSTVMGVLHFKQNLLLDGRVLNGWFITALFCSIGLLLILFLGKEAIKSDELRIERQNYTYYVEDKRVELNTLNIDNYIVEYDDQNKTAKLVLKDKNHGHSDELCLATLMVVSMIFGMMLFRNISDK